MNDDDVKTKNRAKNTIVLLIIDGNAYKVKNMACGIYNTRWWLMNKNYFFEPSIFVHMYAHEYLFYKLKNVIIYFKY